MNLGTWWFFLDGGLPPAYTPAGGAAAVTPGPWQPSLSVGGWPHVRQENMCPNPALAGSPRRPHPLGHLPRDPTLGHRRGPGATGRPALLHHLRQQQPRAGHHRLQGDGHDQPDRCPAGSGHGHRHPGPGANLLTVRRDTGGNYRIFTVSAFATVGISGLTVADGTTAQGGGIYSTGSLALAYSAVSGNKADGGFGDGIGGGIYNAGTMTISYSTVTNNVATSKSTLSY